MKKIYSIALLLLFVLTQTACKKTLDINDADPNYVGDADPKYLLPSGITFSASKIGGDLQLVGSFWSQHYTQNNNSSQYRTLDSYNLTISSYNSTWNNLFGGALKDLKLTMQKSEAQGLWNYYVAAEVMSAFDYHILNDFYGAVPIKAGLDYDNNPQPVYDDSKEANVQILAMLDDAISKVPQAAALPAMGNEDFLFTGDMDNWRKFAKSLKLKILMRDFAANSAQIQTLLTENDLLETDAKMDVFVDSENKSNPLFEQDRRKLNTAANMRASNTLLTFLLENNDPRVAAFYEETVESQSEGSTWPKYAGIEQGNYGLTQSATQSSRAVVLPTDAVFFMSAAEVSFLKAEAYARLNEAGSAKSNYDNGVILAFERWNSATSPMSAASFIAPGGEYAFNGGSVDAMVEQIIQQKWVAAARSQAWDSFFDQNRTGYPRVSSVPTTDPTYVPGRYTISVTSVIAAGQLPRRLLFPKSSSDYNPNAPKVVPITEKMYWHK
ncbi:SusD/RagB family nutrient-binding outer membrane lipoprotein [Arcticibacter sp.]|jgi:hypothetical protein|uniref:SusD/RagB family nutrient-binding outer membrane lipoprotein n=1 Tax=Arcticibacter sp. TaxID=1872630 RepID=UPI00388F4575